VGVITLRRDEERHRDRRGKHDAWQTFHPGDRNDAPTGGFGPLEMVNEDRLPPGASLSHGLPREADIVTYVLDGALAQEDASGRLVVLQAGEFQRLTAGRGVRHTETNASLVDWAHVFQVWLCPSEVGLAVSREQKRFSAAERRGRLCVVASPDGRRGSLRVHQDALLYSAVLDPGQHVVHELSRGRSAWLHLIGGVATLGDVVLTSGDGVGLSEERAVSFTAREQSEVLLIDLWAPVRSSDQSWLLR